MALPKVGVQAAVQNAPGFLAAMKQINAAVSQSISTMQQAATKSSVLTKAYDQISKAAGTAASSVKAGASTMSGAIIGAMQAVLSAVGAVVTILAVALVAAIGAAVAAFGGLAAAAMNAAGFKDIIEGFNGLTAAAGLSASTLVDQLQKASLGTVSKMNLLKATNEALIGTTKDLGTELGQKLPLLMIIAQKQADSLGKDTLDVFNQLTEGIRRGTPRMIESAGISIDMADAQRKYAASVGTTVQQLTDEQKSLATLNAVIEQTGVNIGQLGQQTLDAGDLIGRIGATFQNIFDSVGLALQPALEAVLQIVDAAVTGVGNFISNSMPYIQAIAGFIADALAPVLGIVQGFADQLSSPGLAAQFYTGAANTFGAFVAGVDAAATRIIQAVTAIAQAIADLLLGNSPPPVGPLSNMTTGAANTMQAWLDGFIGQFNIDPVAQVAKQVTDMMGSIATASRDQVAARLSELDTALQPFQDRLTIVKSTFDAITSAAQPALDAIDRQMGKATQALLTGQTGADATVRALDAQRDAIQSVLDVQQNVTDQAQIQLGLVQAQQAQERALLGIRQAQLGPAEAIAAVAKKTAKSNKTPAAPKEPKPKEDKGGSPTPGASSAPLQPGGATFGSGANIGDVAGNAIAKTNLQTAYGNALGSAPDELSGASGALQAQLKRISSVTAGNNRFTKILDPLIQTFKDLPSKLPNIVGDVSKWVQDNIVTPITSGTFDFTPLGTSISTAINGALAALHINPTAIALQIKTALDSIQIGDLNLGELTANIVADIEKAFAGIGSALAPVVQTIQTALKPISDGIKGFVDNLKGADLSGLPGLLKPLEDVAGIVVTVAGMVGGAVLTELQSLFDGIKTVAGIVGEALVKGLGAALPPLGSALKDFINALSGLGKGGDAGFEQFLTGIGNGLMHLAQSALAVPINVVDGIAKAVGSLIGVDVGKGLSAWGPAFDNLKTILGNALTNIQTSLAQLPLVVMNTLVNMSAAVQTSIIQPIEANIITPIQQEFIKLTAGPEVVGSVAYFFTQMAASISGTVGTMGAAVSNAFATVVNFLTGSSGDSTTLSGSIGLALSTFTAFPAQIGAALKSIGKQVYDNFVSPIIDMLNSVIDGFNQLRRNILNGLSDLALSAGNAFSAIPGFQTTLAQAAADLKTQAGQNPIAHIQKADTSSGGGAAFSASGGLWGPGALTVGERGREMITSATKMAVWPHQATVAMESLARLTSPHSVPYAAPGVVNTSYDYSSDRRMTNVFNGVKGDGDVLRRLKMNRAFS